MLKILHSGQGSHRKMGRRRPTKAFTGLKLTDYLIYEKLPAPPIPFSYGSSASHTLSLIYGNDTLGDCVIAGVFHVEGVVTGNAGNEITFTQDQVVSTYGWCGYDPNNPSSDDGCEITKVLDQWKATGLPQGSQLSGYLAVDPTNVAEIQAACCLFENLVFGVELPDAWINPMPNTSGFSWDVAGNPDPENGHCFIAYGATAAGLNICTWGMEGLITYPAVAKYCSEGASGELFVVLTKDMINKATQKAPDGLDWSQLVLDFDSIGGGVAPPPIPDPPSPPPSPPPHPTPGNVVPLPPGAYGIVVGGHGKHPDQIRPLPPGAVGIACKSSTPFDQGDGGSKDNPSLGTRVSTLEDEMFNLSTLEPRILAIEQKLKIR